MIEGTVDKVLPPGSDTRGHRKPTDIRDLKPEIDLRAPDEIRDPLREV
jgi:hypothetical protein